MFSKFVALCVFMAAITALVMKLNQQVYPVLPDDLMFQRIDGIKHPLNELKGKPLLVTFWSPNCVVCMQEVEAFNRLYKNNKGGSEFELLALSMYYDRPDWVIDTSKKAGMLYPVYFDLQKKLSKAFGNVVATPTSFLINKQGEVVYRHAGRLDFSLLNNKLKDLMGSHYVMG